MAIEKNTELYHHGILGQKWGVRRFQNKDGTLTALGKKRLQKLENYKTKEIGKLKKTYDTSKYDSKIQKYKDKLAETGNEKYSKKIDNTTFKKYQAAGLKAAEESSIRHMTYEQMKAEKSATRLNNAKNFVQASSTLGLAASGITGAVIANKANKLADSINNRHGIFSFDNVKEINERWIMGNERRADVIKEVGNRAYNSMVNTNGISGKVLDKTLTLTDTKKYLTSYNRSGVSWVAQAALTKVTYGSLLGGPGAAAVKLGFDVANGRYKSNKSVKSNLRLNYDQRNQINQEARLKVKRG